MCIFLCECPFKTVFYCDFYYFISKLTMLKNVLPILAAR